VGGPVSERTALCEQPHESHNGQNGDGGSRAHAHEGEHHANGIGQKEGRHSGHQTKNDQTDDQLHVSHILCSPFLQRIDDVLFLLAYTIPEKAVRILTGKRQSGGKLDTKWLHPGHFGDNAQGVRVIFSCVLREYLL
jgi:hypothetical protein